MNDIMDIEKMRYTVRSYSDKKVEQEKLDKILEPLVLLLLGYPAEESRLNNALSGKRLPIKKTVFYNHYYKD